MWFCNVNKGTWLQKGTRRTKWRYNYIHCTRRSTWSTPSECLHHSYCVLSSKQSHKFLPKWGGLGFGSNQNLKGRRSCLRRLDWKWNGNIDSILPTTLVTVHCSSVNRAILHTNSVWLGFYCKYTSNNDVCIHFLLVSFVLIYIRSTFVSVQ